MMDYKDTLYKLGITLNKNGKQTCPQCSAKRKNKDDKCLSVTYEQAAVLYNCHHCGWHGAVYYRNKYETVKKYRKPEEPKTTDKLEPLYKYFEKRRISKDTLENYKVSLNTQKEIIFPYYKNGQLVNVKYRTNKLNGEKTFRQEADTEKTLFGMDQVKDTESLIWVEGEIDVLALAEQGIFSVSVPQGAGENKLECIENCFEFIDKFKTHIIAVDNDAAGDKLKNNLLNRLGRANCQIVNWKQYKDADEALMNDETLSEFIKSAEYLAPDGIISFYDRFDEIYEYNYNEDKNYYDTGWTEFDKLVKLRKKRLMVITGYPSRGKSTFINNLKINLSKRHGLTHLTASFEDPTDQTYNMWLEMYREKPIWNIVKDNEIYNGYEFISDHFYNFDDERSWSIDEICERAEQAKKRYGIDTLTIDPYNRLNNQYEGREDKYIGEILAKLIMLAKKLDIIVFFAAHPKKPDGEKMPNMYSISGSADWYNMTDYGVVIHRERLENGKLSDLPLIWVEKVKNHNLGQPSGGSLHLQYSSAKRILQNV